MAFPPQPGKFIPAAEIYEIANGLADEVEAADFPQTILRFRNDRWAASVGLDSLTDAQRSEEHTSELQSH